MGAVYVQSEGLEWQPHPEADGLMMKALLERPEEGITARLHRIPESGVPEHSHARRHVMFVLSGRGRLWTEDLGDLELQPGTFIYIPSDLRHRFYGPPGELVIYTVSLAPGS